MAIYYRDDLIAANFAVETLNTEAQDAENLKISINNFINDSKLQLKGASWDLVRSNLDKYITVLDTRITTARNLANTIKSVNNSLIAALGTNDFLNTDVLTELKSRYTQLNSSIYEIKNSSNDNKMSIDINSMESELNVISKMIKDIENFVKKESSAISQINGFTEINNYNSQTESITVSQIISSEQI